MDSLVATTRPDALAVGLLTRYADGADGARSSVRHDAGPLVLAAVADSVGVLPPGLAHRVVRRWLDECPGRFHAVGAFGGLGGFLAGVRAGTRVDEDLASVADVLVERVPAWLDQVRWRDSAVAWLDYDLFHGPSGLVLAGAATVQDTPRVAAAAEHLARLCADDGLEPLRAGTEIDPRSAFNVGRINTGLGHGVTGVVAALRHAAETLDGGAAYLPALRRACAWLVEQAYLADDGLITWPPVGRDGAPASGSTDRRQAWCYGTPGVAWTLWDAGRVLDDAALRMLGEEAMRTFCVAFDPSVHLDTDDPVEELAVCHGAAGTLAVADAFARHTDVAQAATLRDGLGAYLLERAAQIERTAMSDMTMLSGASGIMAVVLAARGGWRGWLPQLALR